MNIIIINNDNTNYVFGYEKEMPYLSRFYSLSFTHDRILVQHKFSKPIFSTDHSLISIPCL